MSAAWKISQLLQRLSRRHCTGLSACRLDCSIARLGAQLKWLKRLKQLWSVGRRRESGRERESQRERENSGATISSSITRRFSCFRWGNKANTLWPIKLTAIRRMLTLGGSVSQLILRLRLKSIAKLGRPPEGCCSIGTAISRSLRA